MEQISEAVMYAIYDSIHKKLDSLDNLVKTLEDCLLEIDKKSNEILKVISEVHTLQMYVSLEEIDDELNKLNTRFINVIGKISYSCIECKNRWIQEYGDEPLAGQP